jgi:Deoxyhypusine synthase
VKPSTAALRDMRGSLSSSADTHLSEAIRRIVKTKEHGGKVVAVTGSGPNIHEGVTTQIAELIGKGLIDGVITSSAVIAHEMAGTLDRVKRIRVDDDDRDLPFSGKLLPRGRIFEITELTPEQRAEMEREFLDGWDLYDRMAARAGSIVIKAAGNMAWPMGLRTERIAREIRDAASQYGVSLELLAGLGASALTMMGAGARKNVPVLVSIPQLVGGGAVGLAIGDAMPLARRARDIATMLADADVIIESAIALSQEIHDGPFETYTGHGIWAAWDHMPTYSLQDKTLIRIDLDKNLERAWDLERSSSEVQNAVNQGLPKTKRTGIPFRMEMSGFARLESSIPVTGDIGSVWPLIASALEEQLAVNLDFVSAPQESEYGKRMRNWIAGEIPYLDRLEMYREAEQRFTRPAHVETPEPARAG